MCYQATWEWIWKAILYCLNAFEGNQVGSNMLTLKRHWSQIQKLYERHKLAPPLPRNAPPVAGNIMWARQLLRRIEVPMQTWVISVHYRNYPAQVLKLRDVVPIS